MDDFVSRRERHDLHGEFLTAICQGADGSDLRVRAARRLVIGLLATVGVDDGSFVDVEVVVRDAGASRVVPAQRGLGRDVWMRGAVTSGQRHRQREIIAGLRGIAAFGTTVQFGNRRGIDHVKRPGVVK